MGPTEREALISICVHSLIFKAGKHVIQFPNSLSLEYLKGSPAYPVVDPLAEANAYLLLIKSSLDEIKSHGSSCFKY